MSLYSGKPCCLACHKKWSMDTDLDERMHTTPWYHATNIPNVPAKNLVQIGIGGW